MGVRLRSEQVFGFNRNDCSASVGICKQIARKWFEEVWNQRNESAIRRMM
jgi:hypothetical protein